MIFRLSFFPLAFALLLFPSIRYEVALDGASTEYYGFPLPWNARSLATSMAKDIYVLPLAVDFLVFCILGWLVLKAINKLPHNIKNASLALVWCWGLTCAAFLGIAVAIDPFFRLWPDPGYFQITGVKVHVGI